MLNMHSQNGVVSMHYKEACVRLVLRILFFLYRNRNLELIFPNTFVAIESPDMSSSRMHPKYITFECCFDVPMMNIKFS